MIFSQWFKIKVVRKKSFQICQSLSQIKVTNKISNLSHFSIRSRASTSNSCLLIWIRCISSLIISLIILKIFLKWACRQCTSQECNNFMAGFLLRYTNTNNSSLKSPSILGSPDRLMNSCWVCYKLTLSLLKTMILWKISWRLSKRKQKFNILRRKKRINLSQRKKRKNLTQRLNMTQKSEIWWSLP